MCSEGKECDLHGCQYDLLQAKMEELRDALKEIAEGRGTYDLDRLKHCANTVEDMKALANKALTDEEAK